jgi:DNA topoisomerase-1
MVMRIAQSLYERGLITYHRTDSFNLSSSYVFKARDYITATYGKEYALAKPRGFKSKSKNAQEAHEAIRPTNAEKSPEVVIKEKKLNANQRKIYTLIFNRALATQMKEAQVKQLKVFIRGNKGYLFEADFQQVVFDGFLKVLNPAYVERNKDAINIKKYTALTLIKLAEEEKMTAPPPRYSEASLIKILEEWGIGRPSTYASIISLIQDKGYVDREGRYLKPTSLGTAISEYLSSAFPKIFDLKFTANMEEGLDEVADGKKEMVTLLKEFYDPFKENLSEKKSDKKKIEVKDDVKENCPKCGKPLTIKFSRFGKFYACTGYPDCKFTKPLLKIAEGKICPKDQGRVVIRYSRKGKRFFGCENYPKCDYTEFSFLKLINKETKPNAKT